MISVVANNLQEETAMTYVVEIENPVGATAIKEYEATSPYDLVFVVKHDLTPYPDFRVVGAWHKDQPDRFVHIA